MLGISFSNAQASLCLMTTCWEIHSCSW